VPGNKAWSFILPSESLVLPRYGIARELSIPEGTDSYSNRYLTNSFFLEATPLQWQWRKETSWMLK